MARVTEMRYPNGWVEYYTYDKMGRLLAVDDTHPSEKPAKTQKHTYRYDANGNMTYEYMRGNGTGQAKNETLYTYDALNRLITAHDNYGNSTRTYTYDSLGNLTYETGIGSHNCDYIYNNLNQQVDRSSDNWKSHTASTYDNRGNLILEQYGKNKKLETAGEYTYDETDKMVRGVNGNAEESIYTYNGLGALMENTWIIAKNGYGYHDVSGEEDTTTPTNPTPDVPDPGETTDPDTPDPGETTDPDTPDPGETTDPDTPDDGDDTDPGVNNEGNGNNNGNNGNGHSNGNNGNHNGANKGNGNNGSGGNDDNADDPDATDATEATDAIETTAADAGILTASLVAYGNAGNGNNGNNGNGNGNQDKPTGSDVKKTSTVVKQFVVDFSSETFRPLMEHEVNGLDYRYVYSDKARLSVVVQGIENGSASLLDSRGELHAYYHCDYLGTTDYLTSAVNSKVISWTSYSEWGEITHNAVLKCGQRELDLVKEYATHDFDAVLNMYYAKARFYDADNRRFVAVDPILDPSQYDLREYTKTPVIYDQYLYVKNGPLVYVDEGGEIFALVTGAIGAVVGGAVGAYKSYKSTGKVSIKSTLVGAAVGAAVGVGAGALAGTVLAGSATASTAAVASGAAKAGAAAVAAAKSTAATAAKTIRAAGQVAAAKAKTIATAVGTAGSKVAQGIQQVATHITNLSTRVATTAMSQPGTVGTVARNAFANPDAAVATVASIPGTAIGTAQTIKHMVRGEWDEALESAVPTFISGYMMVLGCKLLSTPDSNNSHIDYSGKGSSAPAADNSGVSGKVFYVTKDGVVFDKKIPEEYVESPYRSGSYGLIDPATGKYSEKLRIDPPTPTGKKGPEYSHYHLDGGKEHLSPNPKDNDPWK